MATVTVIKPKPVLVPAASVKGYRPEFLNDPGRAVPPTGFVVQTGPRHGNYAANTPTLTPGAEIKTMATNPGDQTPVKRTGPTIGRADRRFVGGRGRTIIPNNGISLANANGPGI